MSFLFLSLECLFAGVPFERRFEKVRSSWLRAASLASRVYQPNPVVGRAALPTRWDRRASGKRRKEHIETVPRFSCRAILRRRPAIPETDPASENNPTPLPKRDSGIDGTIHPTVARREARRSRSRLYTTRKHRLISGGLICTGSPRSTAARALLAARLAQPCRPLGRRPGSSLKYRRRQ